MLGCAPSYLAGVDPSEDQLAFAQQQSSLKAAEFRKADAMELPFGENEFDAATMALVLFFVPEPRRGVAEMLRVTRPSASISAYVWDIHNGGFPPEPIKAQLQKMGVELHFHLAQIFPKWLIYALCGQSFNCQILKLK